MKHMKDHIRRMAWLLPPLVVGVLAVSLLLVMQVVLLVVRWAPITLCLANLGCLIRVR